MEIKGIVKQLHAAETKGNFTFRNVWITTEAGTQYPQTIEIQASGQKLNLFDNLKEGQEGTFHVNLRGREYNGKVYHSFSAWKVEAGVAPVQQAQVVHQEDASSDLPF